MRTLNLRAIQVRIVGSMSTRLEKNNIIATAAVVHVDFTDAFAYSSFNHNYQEQRRLFYPPLQAFVSPFSNINYCLTSK